MNTTDFTGQNAAAGDPATVRRILLLDDDVELSAIIKTFLAGHGYEVVAVPDGVAGLREIGRRDFDAVICDLMMPAIAGDTFYLSTHQLRPQLCSRFIFISGFARDRRVDDFIRRVNGPILTKPFKVDDLLEMIGFVQVKALLCAA